MEKPPEPDDERERLKALRNLDVLDSGSELRFDRITRLAARSLDTEYAEINLIDEDRQWSKSQYGTRKREKPRDESFCAHVIHEGASLVIPDARQDARFRDNPSVEQFPEIRFYMATPIASPDGYHIGTLCVFDPQPQSPTNEDRETLADLASLAEEEIAKQSETLPDIEPAPVNYGEVIGEVHHQVRNNMQTILSLLDLHQVHETGNDPSRALRRMKQRTRTVALIYDCLVESDGTIEVEMDTYLRELMHDVIQYDTPSPKLEFDVELDPVRMSLERAPVCGLLIHELVMNAVRHGHGATEGGIVRVEFHGREKTGDHVFRVEDDGRGLPDDFDWRSEGGVGMTLIRNITEKKFDGTLRCETNGGTLFEGSF